MKRATIQYHAEPQGWWAESPDLPGWTGVGETFEEVHELAASAVDEILGEGVTLREELDATARLAGEGADGLTSLG